MSKQEICDICCEDMNKSNRKPVTCKYCQFVCCRQCIKTHIMGGSLEPFCMNPECKMVWDQEFVSQNMRKSCYDKEYKNYRANLILEQQKSMLPASQHLVQEFKAELEKKAIIDALMKRKRELKEEMKKIDQDIISIRYNRRDTVERETRFIKACPRADCRGFLSSAWKCGTCDQYSCSKCHEPKNGREDNDHVCNEDTVETVKFLSLDTKPCPKCASLIHKIEGCDQLWCTQCHTAFSWKRGTIETGIIHNPHFYEWQRQRNGGEAPRVAGDIPCGGNIGYYAMDRFIRSLVDTNDVRKKVGNIHRIIDHIQLVEIDRYPVSIDGRDEDSDLRVKYLMGKIDDNKWRSLLKNRTKRREKNKDVNAILNMFVTVSSEIMRRMVTIRDRNVIDNVLEEFDELRDYTNRSLRVIGVRYNNKVPKIKNDWERVLSQ